MSVIVMWMEYPKHCFRCRFKHSGISDYCIIEDRDFDDEDFDALVRDDWHPDWCPLRPLPEKHGRLIDAKVLDAAFTVLRFNDDGTLRHWDDRKNWCLHGGEVESLIADAPTIVEAEGE